MTISIIIPTLNEEENIGSLINYLRKHAGKAVTPQIIVAEAGSKDKTRNIAEAKGAKVIEVNKKSRAVQMNTAVKSATGNIIYFVHADTRPPVNYFKYLANEVENGNRAGCFTSKFDWNHPFLRFCNYFSRLPFWFCRGGGQTLFVTKRLFEQMGGFDEGMVLMEEYDFISRIRKKTNFGIIRKNAITSARDYRLNGAFRLQFIYGYIFFLYSTGASQQKLQAAVNKYVKKA